MRSFRSDDKSPVGTAVSNTAIQSLAAGFSVVVFNFVDYVGGKLGWNSNDPTKLYAKESGLYHLSATWSMAGAAGGIRSALFYKNGNAVGPTGSEITRQGQDGTAVGTTQPGGSISRHIHLEAGDYITMSIYQNSAGAINTAPPGCAMSLIKVS